MSLPRARRDGLRVKETTDGRLAVYDEHAEQGHLLSPLCATVFHLADGHRTLTDLTTAATRAHPTADTTVLRLALTELNTAHLLDNPPSEPDNTPQPALRHIPATELHPPSRDRRGAGP
ncbi:hypothetical protein [Streptomyces broussonetiae]|uniref:PqqD family peptide modification chaperone n=1 Tax=Streptomyces broussonetiae TaxID=2686304 RepID=A0A6I6MP75_9ACTN|nr:hypothetical protein [Streptomyces broussonetiae]QHA02013.1 hypothetical protein GQF42_00215 [Streptomyces broussonetiae]